MNKLQAAYQAGYKTGLGSVKQDDPETELRQLIQDEDNGKRLIAKSENILRVMLNTTNPARELQEKIAELHAAGEQTVEDLDNDLSLLLTRLPKMIDAKRDEVEFLRNEQEAIKQRITEVSSSMVS